MFNKLKNRPFIMLLLAQSASVLGTQMTRFAVISWSWVMTGSVVSVSLVTFFSFVPTLLFTPLAGSFVDKYNRKYILLLSDFGSVLATVVLFTSYYLGSLNTSVIYFVCIFSAISEAFQVPAYTTIIPLLVDKKNLIKANGAFSSMESIVEIIASSLAGVLIGFLGITVILLFDIITFLLSTIILLKMEVPKIQDFDAIIKEKKGFWEDFLFGFKFILEKKSLLYLVLVFMIMNVVYHYTRTLLTPLVLAHNNNNTIELGLIMSIGSAGGLLGGLFMTIEGGFKQRVLNILVGMLIMSVFGVTLTGLGSTFMVWAIGNFVRLFFVPIIDGSFISILQSKIHPAQQGRVISSARVLSQSIRPIAYISAGLLSEYIFEPFMISGTGRIYFSEIVGNTSGSGTSLLLIVIGIIGAITAIIGLLSRTIRDLDVLLPDYE